MAKSHSPVSAVADRYAASLFALAQENNSVAAVEAELGRFEAMIASSDDLQRLIASPAFTADDQAKAVSALVNKAGFVSFAGNFLKVVAQNRRLFAVPGIVEAFRRIAAEARGEVSADVVSAHSLDVAQENELKAALKNIVGKDVTVAVSVDPSLLGGMIVKIGSRQIDTSLKTKLNSLKLALKEVG